MKRFCSLLIAMLLMISVVSCFAEAQAFDDFPRPTIKSKDEIVVAFLRPQLTSEWTVRAVNQVELEFKNRGWKSLILPFENDTQVNDMILNAVKQVCTIWLNGTPLNEEETVARKLLNLDRQAHLTRTGGIW